MKVSLQVEVAHRNALLMGCQVNGFIARNTPRQLARHSFLSRGAGSEATLSPELKDNHHCIMVTMSF